LFFITSRTSLFTKIQIIIWNFEYLTIKELLVIILAKKIDKLKKYLDHWAEHNDSHLESFIKWRDIAKEEGWDSASENLTKAIEMMDESTKYLKMAKEGLE